MAAKNTTNKSSAKATTKVMEPKESPVENKPLVVDDIDCCFQFMCFPDIQIAACSMVTYDPSEVALTPPTTSQKVPQDECVCDSLI